VLGVISNKNMTILIYVLSGQGVRPGNQLGRKIRCHVSLESGRVGREGNPDAGGGSGLEEERQAVLGVGLAF
jgi:hypothetical protein